MKRLHQGILIFSVVVMSWLGMQAVHEAGHVLAAWLTGGQVQKVVWRPLTISRTDVNPNPRPLLVVWAGPIFGVFAPLSLWGLAAWLRTPGTYVLRFLAGFCLIANGAYIAGGSFGRVGDCGEMLRHGSVLWQLWLFGIVTVPAGLWLWHGQGENFGLGPAQGKVDHRVAYASAIACAALIVLSLWFGGR